MTDCSKFPDPTYQTTVLAPLFEGVKTHYAADMGLINKAHLVMLAETGILPREVAGRIARTLAKIAREVDIPALVYTGEHEDYFFLVEAELKARLGDLGGMLHTARSRNDMDHTLFKMALRQRAAKLQGQLLWLAEKLLAKARAERDTLIVAYTHGQPAQPTTFGHYLAAVLDVVLADTARMDAAMEALDHCPMGSAAITTTGFPIDRKRMAELLGFEEPTANSYASIAGVDYITGLYSAVRLVFLHVGRVIQDLQFWSSFEVGQLFVPDSLVQISSIMPQKRNPVPIEHLRHLASATCGRADTVLTTLHNTPFTDMNDSEGEVQQAGYAAFYSGGRALDLLAALISCVSINAERVAANTDRACITITELADTLVREDNLSFRQAHEIAAATAKAVIAEGKPLREGYAAFCDAFARIDGSDATLSETAFAEATDARTFVARRDRPGGPAPAALDAALNRYEAQHAALVSRTLDRGARQAKAAETLTDTFNSLLED